MDSSHVAENTLAILVDVIELDVVDIIFSAGVSDIVIFPVTGPVRHESLDIDGGKWGVGEVVVLECHVVPATYE